MSWSDHVLWLVLGVEVSLLAALFVPGLLYLTGYLIRLGKGTANFGWLRRGIRDLGEAYRASWEYVTGKRQSL